MTQKFSLNTSIKLPFSHGVEIENHLTLKESGEILVGDNLIRIWDEMFNRAYEYILEIKNKKKGPKEIIQKIKKIKVEEVEKHGHSAKLKFIWVHYKLGKNIVKVNVFGPDPNISQITWLLELVSPPCEYLEELDWWITTLYDCALHGLKNSKPEVVLLPIGLNPLEERFRSGLSCGSHHHIGVPPLKERVAVYNMLRNFVPHLIALTSTSPFINRGINGTVKIREINGKKQVIGRYTHSNRLANNTGQIGPNIPQYLPILKESATKEEFSTLVKKVPPEDRMVDIYPFTDYDTIELRFFDAQPFKENRLAIILLLQALAMKAVSLAKAKKKIPSVQSRVLFENRKKSIELGLLAQFTTDPQLNSFDPEFDKIYNFNVLTGKKASKLMDSVKSMLFYLKEELESFTRPDILNNLLLPVFGTEKFEAPFSITEYLVDVYQSFGSLLDVFSKIYYKSGISYSFKGISDLSTLVTIGSEMKTPKTELSSKLSSQLQKDLLKRKKQENKEKKSSKKLSKKATRKSPKKPVRKMAKSPTKKLEKKLTKQPKIEVEIQEIKREEKADEVFIVQEDINRGVSTQVSEQNNLIISAFDIIEEEDMMIPAIEIEPKYTKIESKIANVMRKRRIEIEKKKKELYKEHLEAERVPIHPAPKKIKLQFPNQVSGHNVFGSITIEWHPQTIFKLRKNPIYFYITAIKPATKERYHLKTYSTTINTKKALSTGSSYIPLVFSLETAVGELEIDINAITATNETILWRTFSLIRKDEIAIETMEFYINGNYGPVECIYQAKNNNSDLKGNLELYLAVQERDSPILIKKEQFLAKQGEIFSFFSFVNIDPIYHNTPFFIVSRITTGRFKKSRHYEAIRIKPIQELIVDWYICTPDGKPDIKEGIFRKTKYEIDVVFHFNKSLPPISLAIYLITLPEGVTKKIATSEIKRDIDPGDELIVNQVKFKTPKNIGYIIFEVEIRTKEGFVPVDLISDPIGISAKLDK
jgi:hypothetical protein